jgi:hypothetical protein
MQRSRISPSAYSVDVAANEVGKRWQFHSYTLSNTD